MSRTINAASKYMPGLGTWGLGLTPQDPVVNPPVGYGEEDDYMNSPLGECMREWDAAPAEQRNPGLKAKLLTKLDASFDLIESDPIEYKATMGELRHYMEEHP